jgi:hypothetical protein
MVKSNNRKRKFGTDNKHTKQNIQITTKKICNTYDKGKNENTYNNTTNKQNKFNTNRHSHTQIRSRTRSPIDITLSDNDVNISSECIIDIPNKYKQQNNKTKHFSKNNKHTPPIQSGANIHPGSNRKFAIQNIQHGEYINIDDSTITNRREHAFSVDDECAV